MGFFEGQMRRRIFVIAFALCLAPISTISAAETAAHIAAGRSIAAGCAACHGSGGMSPQAGLPHIAGQHAAYIQSALTAYKTGARKDESMQKAVAKLSDRDIADVSAYYASLTGFNSRPKQP